MGRWAQQKRRGGGGVGATAPGLPVSDFTIHTTSAHAGFTLTSTPIAAAYSPQTYDPDASNLDQVIPAFFYDFVSGDVEVNVIWDANNNFWVLALQDNLAGVGHFWTSIGSGTGVPVTTAQWVDSTSPDWVSTAPATLDSFVAHSTYALPTRIHAEKPRAISLIFPHPVTLTAAPGAGEVQIDGVDAASVAQPDPFTITFQAAADFDFGSHTIALAGGTWMTPPPPPSITANPGVRSTIVSVTRVGFDVVRVVFDIVTDTSVGVVSGSEFTVNGNPPLFLSFIDDHTIELQIDGAVVVGQPWILTGNPTWLVGPWLTPASGTVV